jgi:very-short-patch-repair endonuclease
LGILKTRSRSARKKPLKRKSLKARRKFKAFGANAFKPYRRPSTDQQVMAKAQECRLERLRNRTRAEMAFAELLDRLRILYEVEKIFLNGDRWISADFYIKQRILAVELDRGHHQNQKEYDRERDEWLLRQYGVRTIRLVNCRVFVHRENEAHSIEQILKA